MRRARMAPARRLLLLSPAAALTAALLPLGWLPRLPLCAFKALTGLDCPGCGMTRAFALLGQGRVAEASAMHPASVPAFLIVVGMAATGIVRVVRDRGR